MRKMMILLMSVSFSTIGILVPAKAELATPEEAIVVAQNWITLIIEKEGNWGGADAATVKELYDLTHGGRLIGYLFRVEPYGYIVISLYKELPPVQAYSETGDFDPQSDSQTEGIIKEEMARLLDNLEGAPHPELSIQSEAQLEASQTDNRSDWDLFMNSSKAFAAGLKSGELMVAYVSGNVLLTSSWSQGDPYNRKCPRPTVLSGCAEERCSVGCTPLAGAQIMRYWAWPPDYDWTNMPDTLTDESRAVQIEAVATLCYEVGAKAGAIYCVPGYGCQTFLQLIDLPLTTGPDLEDALKDHFSYHKDADGDWRITESPGEWFQYFQNALNKNRPVPYELGTGWHTVVCDGWRVVGGARQLHLNYGWGGKDNGWWTLDTQPLRGKGENIIRGLRPNCAVGTSVTGRHVGLSGGRSYVYFDQDALPPQGWSHNVEYIGYSCQFLPGVRLRTRRPDATTEASIRFVGSPTSDARLYSIKGTAAGSIKIRNGGAIRLEQGGGIRFF